MGGLTIVSMGTIVIVPIADTIGTIVRCTNRTRSNGYDWGKTSPDGYDWDRTQHEYDRYDVRIVRDRTRTMRGTYYRQQVLLGWFWN